MAKLAKVKAALAALECSVKSETRLEPPGSAEKEWHTIEELFPDHHAGHAVRGLRYREDMTQKQLAEAAGISVANLSHMEHGRRPIGKEMAKRLAKVLNTDWRLLLS
jgi:DNA-binding XRE family transcriptional regulator